MKSLRKNAKGIVLMIVSSICACIGQLLWKISATYGFPFLAAGFFLYGIGAVIMIVAYRFGKLSVLQPILSLNYVLSIILASIFLNEVISIWNCVGVCVIIAGVILIAGGDKE